MRDRLHAEGIDTFEADVRFAVRYLIERGIKGGCEIEGVAVGGTGVTWIFDDPELRPAKARIEPRVSRSTLKPTPRDSGCWPSHSMGRVLTKC